MALPLPMSQTVHFDAFEVDLRAGELRKHGIKIRLQEQPFRILQMLLENAGQVVTREDLSKKIWPGDTFVDFDHGLHAAVNRLRQALADSADRPRYIETVARRGYRFIGNIQAAATQPASDSAAKIAATTVRRRIWNSWTGIFAGFVIAIRSEERRVGKEWRTRWSAYQ